VEDVYDDWLAADLLAQARLELQRADEKCNTLFRFYGVAMVLLVGVLLGGTSASTTHLHGTARSLLWLGTGLIAVALVILGAAVYPRIDRTHSHEKLAFFGDVIRYDTAGELEAAIAAASSNRDGWMLHQVMVTSRIVHQKYRLLRGALLFLLAGAVLCAVAIVLR
jgi:hypothetical protein